MACKDPITGATDRTSCSSALWQGNTRQPYVKLHSLQSYMSSKHALRTSYWFNLLVIELLQLPERKLLNQFMKRSLFATSHT